MRRQKILLAIDFIIVLLLTFPSPQSKVITNSNDSNLTLDLDDDSSWIINWDNYSWRVKAMITDTSENVYCAGVIDLNPPGYMAPSEIVSIFISKINGSGIKAWTLTFDYDHYFLDLEIDSDGNIYSLLHGDNYKSSLLKLNSSGSLIWNYTLNDLFYEIYLDIYGNAFLLGYRYHVYNILRLVKINKLGVMQFDYSISKDPSMTPMVLRIDELNNTYIASYEDDLQRISLYKINSSNDLILVKELDQRPQNWDLFFDDIDNLYIFGLDNSYSNILFKYDASGNKLFNITWKSFSPLVYQSFWDKIAADPSGNIFCAGLTRYNTLTSFSEVFLVKFSGNGILMKEYIWRKYHQMISLNDIHLDQQNNIYLVGTVEEGSFIVKNPLLDDYSINIFNFYLDKETMSTLVSLSIFFGVWSLLGISLYVFYIRKSKRLL